MGVRKYHNRYRAYFYVMGKPVQIYTDSEEHAHQLIEDSRKFNHNYGVTGRWCSRFKKRVDAKAKDLPIGFTDTFETRVNKHGDIKRYHYLRFTFNWKGKSTKLISFYGKKRTRNEALIEIMKKLNKDY